MKNQINNMKLFKNTFVKSAVYPFLLLFAILGCGSNSAFSASVPNQVIITEDTPWFVADNESEAVQRAIEDVKKDCYAVFGRLPIVSNKIPDTWKGSLIYFGEKPL